MRHMRDTHAYEMNAPEEYSYGCTPVRYTPMRHTPMRYTPLRCTPERFLRKIFRSPTLQMVVGWSILSRSKLQNSSFALTASGPYCPPHAAAPAKFTSPKKPN